MPVQKNIFLPGPNGLPILLDVFTPDVAAAGPVIVYAHGFNGFKDWGGMDAIARRFADAGFCFVKFNFSHNGTTPAQPEDFADLVAYAANTYTKELADLRRVTDWIADAENPFAALRNRTSIGLIGHSRGGGIALIGAAEDARFGALATWASVSECRTPWGSWLPEKLAAWQADGVAHIRNARTGQDMPLAYALYEDFVGSAARLDVEAAARRLVLPWLIVHGTADTSVPIQSAERLREWQPAARTFFLETDHTFGRRHPWTEAQLPAATEAVVNATIAFFGEALA